LLFLIKRLVRLFEIDGKLKSFNTLKIPDPGSL